MSQRYKKGAPYWGTPYKKLFREVEYYNISLAIQAQASASASA